MLKKNLSCTLWLGLLNLPLALYFASAYAPPVESSPWFVLGAFTCAAVGLFFIYFALATLILIFPAFCTKKPLGVGRYLYATLIITLLHIVLATDAQVFALYRFHLSYAMLDLFINGGGEIISLSADTWLSIGLQILVIVGYALVTVGLARFLSHHVRARFLVFIALFMYVLANLVHAYAAARQVLPIMEIQNRLPLYRPLTMNSLLTRIGLISPEELANRHVSISNGIFDYPKADLSYAAIPVPEGAGAGWGYVPDAAVIAQAGPAPAAIAGSAPYNVLILTVDALRADMISPEIMPYTAAFAQNAWQYTNHYSASNSTRGGIFGLFYGLPPSYWQFALNSGIPSVVTTAVQHRGYQYGIFTSATLVRPEFNATVFAGVPNLRLGSDGAGDVISRDNDAIADFEAFLQGLETDDSFFSFIFLDNVHSYATPVGTEPVFTPVPASINHMELNKDTDPQPIRNLYMNAAHYADQNVQRILEMLEASGRLERTIVIITSDHGEEFNDNGDNYWGHNSNFTDTQIKIPFIMKWPYQEPRVITTVTSAYDVTATLLPRVFGVLNPRSDYTVGQDLFAPHDREYVLAGSYLENAIVESDRIVLIDNLGMLRFKDKRYQDSTDTTRDGFILDAIKQMSYFMQGVERITPEATSTPLPQAAVATPEAAATEAADATDAAGADSAAPDAASAAPAPDVPADAEPAPAELVAPTSGAGATLQAVPVEPAADGIATMP